MIDPLNINGIIDSVEPFFAEGKFPYGSLRLNYRYHTPEQLEPGQRAPLVVIMHGAGSIGSDNRKQLYLSGLFCRHPASNWRNCFILAPQCPENHKWIDPGQDWSGVTYRFKSGPTAVLSASMALIRQFASQFPVDHQRIYVGGCSMGGYATWELLLRMPNFFAAGFPICGGTDVNTARQLRNMPLQVFHGDSDPVVNLENSRKMVAALRALGASVVYHEYSGVQHNSWVNALQENEFFEWLFRQRKA